MLARKLFLISSELFGVNFRKQFGVKVSFILIFHLSLIIHNFYYYVNIRFEKKRSVSIFTIISLFQSEVLVILHFVLSFRAFLKQEKQKEISEKIYVKFKVSDSKIDVKFLLQAVLIVFVRILKIIMSGPVWFTQNIKMISSELVLVSNDFMFVYFVSSLNSNLKNLKSKISDGATKASEREIYQEIFSTFETKRDLDARYSTDLFMTIFYNFVQLIIDLYFSCMRIIFNNFAAPIGNLYRYFIL